MTFASGLNDCPFPGPYMLAENSTDRQARLFRTPCKRWGCPYCGARNKAKWAARASYATMVLTEQGQRVFFVTLTFPGWMNQAGTLERWRKSWPKLSARIRRASPGVQYLYVHEQHRNGNTHVHLLCTAVLSLRWYKDNAAQCGFGFIADTGVVRSPSDASAYINKNLDVGARPISANNTIRQEVTKDLLENNWPRGWRRVSTSRHWPKFPDRDESDVWRFRTLGASEELLSTYETYQLRGWHIRNVNASDVWKETGGET